MKVAAAQINSTIGDFGRNTDKVLEFAHNARSQGAELVVFPEMSLCGYPPMDLLDHTSFVDESLKQLRRVQHEAPPDIGLVIGYIDKNRYAAGKPLHNMAALISNHEILLRQAKTLLPTYDVFDESRYFEPSRRRDVVPFRDVRLGIAICEDIWWESEAEEGARYPVDPVTDLLDSGASLIVAPSASPFYSGKSALRLSLLYRIGRSSGVPVVYVNMVGGNDSLIFDGQSLLTRADGSLVRLGKPFVEDLIVHDLDEPGEAITLPTDRYQELEQALVLGIRDYLSKTGFKRVHVALSGGIDSAVVLVLAVRAVGPENVMAFSLPSRYSSDGSKEDARLLAKRLGIRMDTMPIEPVFAAFLKSLEGTFSGLAPDITEENLQARIRGSLMMAYSNKTSSLLMATGNKSEFATGYCTLYGDMNGSLAVIGDLLKTEVYALARAMNREGEIIPAAILEKAPSAELRPEQQDTDSLPPYDILDRILDLYLINSLTIDEIVSEGYHRELVERVLRMVGRAEYKRRQAAPVLKVSPRAFGTGRRMPLARRIYEAG